jgi:hypothetical protein
VGESTTTVTPGTQLVILDGPERGPIQFDNEIQGDWYQVSYLDDTAPLGWIWQERLTLTDEVRLVELADGPSLFRRDLVERTPRMFGRDVLIAQGRLRALGYSTGPVDGYFGPLTTAAVRAFQQRNDLSTDGVINPVTWNRLLSSEAISAA